MYALASLGLRCSAGGFCVAGAALGALQGVGCTPWRPLVSAALSVAFAWQAQHLVLCKGSDVRPGVPWSPLLCRWLLRGRGGTWCFARGRMYALASLGLCLFCVAGVGHCAHTFSCFAEIIHTLTHARTHARPPARTHARTQWGAPIINIPGIPLRCWNVFFGIFFFGMFWNIFGKGYLIPPLGLYLEYFWP